MSALRQYGQQMPWQLGMLGSYGQTAHQQNAPLENTQDIVAQMKNGQPRPSAEGKSQEWVLNEAQAWQMAFGRQA